MTFSSLRKKCKCNTRSNRLNGKVNETVNEFFSSRFTIGGIVKLVLCVLERKKTDGEAKKNWNGFSRFHCDTEYLLCIFVGSAETVRSTVFALCLNSKHNMILNVTKQSLYEIFFSSQKCVELGQIAIAFFSVSIICV